MLTLVACRLTSVLAPAQLSSTPQNSGPVPSSSPDRIVSSSTATAVQLVTATPQPPTTQPPPYPTGQAHGNNTGLTPTSSSRPPSPTSELTASNPSPASSLQPTATFTFTRPPASPTTARSDLSVYTGEVTLLTYPYRDFLSGEQDSLYGILVQRLDRAAYEATTPQPSPQRYQALVIENTFLRLTFLPELGGRLYSVVVKATDQEIFYHNPVVKPSRYGPLLPIEDNWWLAVGGMEWAFPVQEHGYAWGVPWTYNVSFNTQGVTVTLRDNTDGGRLRAEVRVTLPDHSPAFSIQPRLINGTDRALPVQFWLNAALAPGSPSLASNTQIILPVSQVVVHSRGEAGWQLPEPRSPMPWPVASDHDLSHYEQWANYLGFFIPYMQANFMAVYNPSADLGISRIVSPGQIPGHKIFAFGPDFSDRSYTDDNSQYLEMWGGANTSFWPENDIQLGAGDVIEWYETWWPLAGLGGLTFANDQVAFHLLDGSNIRILSVRKRQVTLILSADGFELSRTSLVLDPAQVLEWAVAGASSPSFRVQLITPSGDMIADYQTSPQPTGTSL